MNFSRHLENVTDSSDWNSTKVPLLYQLESLQRCFICKEFMTAPVITSCNHTFCSRCIREYLLSNNCCPLCKSQQFESNLRRVVVLEEIINCFTSLRPHLLSGLAKEEALSSENGEEEGSNEDSERVPPTPERSEVIEVLSDEEPPLKKAKVEDDDLVECPVCVKRMPADFLQTKHIDQCLSGDANAPVPKSDTGSIRATRTKAKSKHTSISSFFRVSGKQQAKRDMLKDDHENFYFNEVDKHVTKDKRLPKLDFSSLTTPKLKEKLHHLHISTTGTRHQLELRYNQYYILYNSNLDSNRPVDVKILQLKLNQWESGHLAFRTGTATLFDTANGLSSKNVADKDFSGKLWKRVYQQEFEKLIAQAQKLRRSPEELKIAAPEATVVPDQTQTSSKQPEKSPISQPDPEGAEIRHGLQNSTLFVPDGH